MSRLEEMERRLMEQMKQAGVTVPGVTVPGVNEPGVNEPNSTTDLSVLAPPQPLKKRKLPFQKGELQISNQNCYCYFGNCFGKE